MKQLVKIWLKTASCLLLIIFTVSAGELTVIQITDEVIVNDTVRLGLNLGSDSYYSGSVLTKMRAVENFEGMLLRQCHFGPFSLKDGVSTWFNAKWSDWDKFALNREIVLLSGSQQWERRKIVKITTRSFKHRGKLKPFRFFVLDKPIVPLPQSGGFMILGSNSEMGHANVLHHYWNTKSNILVHGDVRPGGFGHSALKLAGAAKPSHYLLPTHYQQYGDLNGKWKVRFWAKAFKDGSELKVIGQVGRLVFPDKVNVPAKWTKFERTIIATKVPEPEPGKKQAVHLTFKLKADNADILIDDIEVWQEGDTNPTAFRDDCVAVLKKYHPGILRTLQMGGSTIDNMLSPRLKMLAFASQQNTKDNPFQSVSRYSYSLPEFYKLCEVIEAEPWYCLPGTMLPEEIDHFMEYIAGPEDSSYGQRRVADGHPEPWTDTLKRIHVEFGNEAWNNSSPYQCGGFNGADYWRSLIARAKDSPYYRKNIIFHSAGQAANTWANSSIIMRTPNADSFSVAPYIIHNMLKKDMDLLKNDDDLFKWVFAWPLDRSLSPNGSMVKNYELGKKAGIGLSVYEVNHHITNGDVSAEPRNKIVTSIGGGISVCNTMLLMLREQGIRSQCLFSLIQKGFRTKVGEVRLWGTALNMRKGHERYRPTFLAAELANRVMGGDLQKTIHSSNQPKFTGRGRFEDKKPNTSRTFPDIWSYAFKDKNRRGLILFNLDTSKNHDVQIKFSGDVADGARQYQLLADKIYANNEFENATPQVVVKKTNIPDFTSGKKINLPAYSMQVLAWTIK